MKKISWVFSITMLVCFLMINELVVAQDTDQVQEQDTDSKPSLRADNPFGIEAAKPTMRNDLAVVRDSNQTREPLAYQYIRPVDAIWGKRVWVEIDTKQKMNLAFTYPGYDEQGNSLTFINILLNAVASGEVTAFNPIDDRFTTPYSPDEVSELVHGEAEEISVIDPETGEEEIQQIQNDFDPNSVDRYRLKQDWVFDKQTSTLYQRIIGIAPLKTIYNNDGSVRAHTPMFWLYYPDLRPILARYDVTNPKNFYQRISWEDLFEMKFYSGFIVKEDNPFDRNIKSKIPGETRDDGIKRLLEGQRIREEIFDYEQNLWQY